MSIVVVDSSTIISCAINCLMWIFDELYKYGIRFIVPEGVKKEVIDSGLKSKRFKYEAIRVLRHFSEGTFEIFSDDIRKETSELLNYANSSFYVRGKPMRILQFTDGEVIALANKINADAILTDEKTLRMLIESPDFVKNILEKKFKEKVRVNEKSLHEFTRKMKSFNVIRSVDIVAFAYSLGVFEKILWLCKKVLKENCEQRLIEGLLYSLKFSGCAVSLKEINDYLNILMRKKW